MKKAKKIFAMCFALALGVMSLATTVFADTVPYNWTFSNTSGVLPTSSGLKNDNVQKYVLTINGGNISATNRFGTRIRKASNEAAVSGYIVHNVKKTSVYYNYSTTVNKSTRYLMRGKKDDSSTTSTALKVSGRITY